MFRVLIDCVQYPLTSRVSIPHGSGLSPSVLHYHGSSDTLVRTWILTGQTLLSLLCPSALTLILVDSEPQRERELLRSVPSFPLLFWSELVVKVVFPPIPRSF